MPKYRAKGYRLWRNGHAGLIRLQEIVDRLIDLGAGSAASDDARRELMLSSLPDLKIRLNKELRDNAMAEQRHRREGFELDDIERARKNQVPLLLRLKRQVEEQAEQLIALADLHDAVSGSPIVQAEMAQVPPEAPEAIHGSPGLIEETTTPDHMPVDPGTPEGPGRDVSSPLRMSNVAQDDPRGG